MGRYLDSVCKLCRREGVQLFLKGMRCHSPKCAVVKRKTVPGFIPAKKFNRRVSDFGLELREKQKVKRMYGILRERQFRNIFKKAEKRKGKTSDLFIENLEMRLDSILVRCHFAISYVQARQFISHGHFLVNDKRVNIASYVLKEGDSVKAKSNTKITNLIRENLKEIPQGKALEWLHIDQNNLECRVLSFVSRSNIDIPINEQLIVEFYSK